MAHWLHFVPGSAAFKAELAGQLAADAQAKAGIDPRRGFVLMPVDDAITISWSDAATGSFEADLVGPDARGYRVRAAWTSAADSAQRVEPGNEHPGALRAWWSELPDAELRERYGSAAPDPFALADRFRFPVVVERVALPDVWLQVRVTRDLDAGETAAAEAAMEARREAHNRDPSGGKIHGLTRFRRLGSGLYELHVDLGSAAPEALGELLRAMVEAASGWEVVALQVRGFPLGDAAIPPV